MTATTIDRVVIRLAGVMIMLLLGIISYFLSNMDKSIQESTRSIQQLKIEFQTNKTESVGTYKIFEMRISQNENKIKCNSDDIKELKNRLR